MTIAALCLALFALPPDGAERTGEPILLDFTASWCGPCRQMRPVVEQLARKGYPIRPIDLDENPELAERYDVKSVPTFLVVDPSNGRELARTMGVQPAEQLANLYLQAKAKFRAEPPARDRDRRDDDQQADDVKGDEDDQSAEPVYQNPKPWETAVRIKVQGQGSIGYGSGTVIYSSPEESTILTCAHIFKLEGQRHAEPSRFPRRVAVDLFDGRLNGSKQVHATHETYDAQVIDYDFGRDVGLIRIRPGRRIPFARVVPPHWVPRKGFAMITVGCPEGRDATTWGTRITNPAMRGLQGNNAYEAIECLYAPKQGRSGGGLFTSDGYVAGVCDFAEPRGQVGLYAAPRSIHHLLDRNKLAALYAPVRTPGDVERLLAEGGRRAPSRARTVAAASSLPPTAPSVARAQSHDNDEPGVVTIPDPTLLGIKPPTLAGRRQSWHATPAGMKLDPSLNTDKFDTASLVPSPSGREPIEPETPAVAGRVTLDPSPASPEPSRTRPSSTKWRPVRSALPELAGAGAN
jgi:thiol-disulfide isomerase/thioredoxin